MSTPSRKRLWRVLGGATDERGSPAPSADDWADVFEGAPIDAAELSAALGEAGLEVDSRTYVPSRFYGWPEPTRAILSVRVPDATRALSLIEGLPHLGNAAVPDEAVPHRQRGFASLAEFATQGEVETAVSALRDEGIPAEVTAPLASHLDDVGYVVSVKWGDLGDAVDVIQGMLDTDETGSFNPRDLAAVDSTASPRSSSRSTGTKLRWVGWAFATFVLGLTALSLVVSGLAGIVRGEPLHVLLATAGAGVGYGAWLARRRLAAIDD